MATQIKQCPSRGYRLDAFGDDVEPKGVSQGYNLPQDRQISRVCPEVDEQILCRS